MSIDDQVKNCVAYIEKTYPNVTALSMQDIIKIALKYGEEDARKHAAEWYKNELEREKKQKELEATREDYKEEIDEEGKIWYRRTHLCHQRDESRKLKPGDIIQYKAYLSGYEGTLTGIMLINNFDFKSDFACRGYFNIQISERYKKADKWEDMHKEKEDPIVSWSAGGAPGIYAFSLATEDEIKNFFNTIKEDYPEQYKFYFTDDFKYKPDYLKNRYAKYIETPNKTE